MCGIVGFINVGNSELIQKSTDVLEHRGPDDQGVEWFEKWGSGFGHRRLSIIDLSSAGHQPMCSDDGRYWITFNGEIYNYAEINSQLSIINSQYSSNDQLSSKSDEVMKESDEVMKSKEGNKETKGQGDKVTKYKFKSKSDTETLLYAYMEWGEKCLDRLNGMFAFAIFDILTGEVFAARDRLGIKPFYYAEVDGGLIFASEVKAIFASGLVKAEPDYFALENPMHYQLAPLTGFKGVYKLEAGHVLKFRVKDNVQLFRHSESSTIINYQLKNSNWVMKVSDEVMKESDEVMKESDEVMKKREEVMKESDGEMKESDEVMKESDEVMKESDEVMKERKYELVIKRWWKLQVREDDRRSEEELVDELDRLLNDAVRMQMVSDVPVGILLSGGLDSSIIAALMRKHYKGTINAFTIKFSKEDQKFEKLEDDSVWAKKVADLFEFNYEEMIVKPDTEKILPEMVYHLDEPTADPAAINTYLISKFARQNNIIVLLSGMGGDEVFGGYRKHLACLKADVYQKYVPGFVRNLVEGYFNTRMVASRTEGFKLIRWIKRFLSFASYDRFERFLLSDIGLNKKDFREVFKDAKGYEESFFYKKEKGFYDQLSISNYQLPIKEKRDFSPLISQIERAIPKGIETDFKSSSKELFTRESHEINEKEQQSNSEFRQEKRYLTTENTESTEYDSGKELKSKSETSIIQNAEVRVKNEESKADQSSELKDKREDKEISYLTKMCYCDTMGFMISHNMIYSDKASMMASVEARPPLTDHRIVEFMFSLPPKYRINGNMQKYLLKKVAERYLPKDVVHRPKAPFGSPLRSWVRGELSGKVDTLLSVENLKRVKNLNGDKIRDIVMRDRCGKEDLAHVVYRFLVQMTWWDVFFEE